MEFGLTGNYPMIIWVLCIECRTIQTVKVCYLLHFSFVVNGDHVNVYFFVQMFDINCDFLLNYLMIFVFSESMKILVIFSSNRGTVGIMKRMFEFVV